MVTIALSEFVPTARTLVIPLGIVDLAVNMFIVDRMTRRKRTPTNKTAVASYDTLSDHNNTPSRKEQHAAPTQLILTCISPPPRVMTQANAESPVVDDQLHSKVQRHPLPTAGVVLPGSRM